MTRKNMLLSLLLPVIAMLMLTGVLVVERKGMMIEARGASLALLNTSAQVREGMESNSAEMIVACNSANDIEMAFSKTVTDVLSEMRIPYRMIDLSSQRIPEITAISTLLYCSQSLMPLKDDVERLSKWMEAGGHLGLLMTPAADATFRMLYRKLGITEYRHEYVNYTTLKYISGLLPLWNEARYSESGTLSDFTLAVRLAEDCTVHIVTG
jgi:hypothetical protein